MNCGEKDGDSYILMVTMTVTVGEGEDEDGDVHRSHGDAGQEATAKTCHPLQIRFLDKKETLQIYLVYSSYVDYC